MEPREQTEFFYEIFDASLPRLGPGDEASTERALDTVLPAMSPTEGRPLRILDIGCGNGAGTLCVAQHVDGSILAVDNHRPFLDELQRRAADAGVAGKIQVACRDMRTLAKDEGPFDLIWSEGAIFIVGFREGLRAWHSLLAPGGGLAVSEVAWLRPDPPAECREFWTGVYPGMTDVAAHLATLEACGYEVLGHFVQLESAWWEPYYHPLEERLRILRNRYAGDTERLTVIESIQMEIDIYRKYPAYCGNVFYVMHRR
ncbi:MAG: methyltransferase domain-containing protein [Sedimentisphaerales bacterium]|nr:methyltransferase domain-containing protein [Sedimentisphaerales bacterium]